MYIKQQLNKKKGGRSVIPSLRRLMVAVLPLTPQVLSYWATQPAHGGFGGIIRAGRQAGHREPPKHEEEETQTPAPGSGPDGFLHPSMWLHSTAQARPYLFIPDIPDPVVPLSDPPPT